MSKGIEREGGGGECVFVGRGESAKGRSWERRGETTNGGGGGGGVGSTKSGL